VAEHTKTEAKQSTSVPPTTQIQTRPFAAVGLQETAQGETQAEKLAQLDPRENLYMSAQGFSPPSEPNDFYGSSQSLMQRKWEGVIQRYRQKRADAASTTAEPIQAKLAIGAVGDKYEQEADQVASQVVQKINTPEQNNLQREELADLDSESSQSNQPDEFDENIETSNLLANESSQIQPKIAGTSPNASPISAIKNPIPSLQREVTDEEKGLQEELNSILESSEVADEDESEDESSIQMKSMLQRREDSEVNASQQLESSIQQARGGGHLLDLNLQRKMEDAIGADFSKVKIHTDSQSDRMSKSIQAKAFTTGQDVFFRQGAYNPSSKDGQELIAHELTHTIQQSGGKKLQLRLERPGHRIIQRKDGLPSAKDATSGGGKAGFKAFGKTTWAKILKALNDFKAIKDDQKDAQAAKLLELQDLTIQWLSSGQRKKQKAKDKSKENFLAKIRPTIKVLFYEAQTKSKTVDKVKANAATHAGENRQLIEAKLLQENLDASKGAIDALLNRLKSAKLTTNFNPDTLDFLIKSPDFKSIWQLAYKDKSPGGTLPPVEQLGGSNQREDAERYLGYDPFTESQRENRPAYCGINVLNNPKGAAPSYGRFFFEFNDSVKARATYTAFDTFAMRKEAGIKDVPAEKAIASSENMEAILAHNSGVLKVMSNLLAGINMTEEEVKKAMGYYIEAQIHGGLSVDDFSALVVNYPQDEKNQNEFQKMDAEYVKRFATKYPSLPIRYSS
jgi:hypothetical protein